MFIVMLIAVILRLVLTNSSYFVWARYVYDINLIMFYLRILQLFYIHPHLGPKVIVIGRMVCVIISRLLNLFIVTPRICNFMLLLIWVRSFSKMLPSVKFAEDKVLVFVILH